MAKKLVAVNKVAPMEEDLINAKNLTEKRLFKLIDKYEAIGEEITSTKLTLELIETRMEELGIEENKETAE